MLSAEKRALAEFQQALLDRVGGNLCLVELFGSKARGECYPEADIDLIVVLENRTYEISKDVCGIALGCFLEV